MSRYPGVPDRIAIDVDETVAQAHAPWIDWINQNYGAGWDRRRGLEYWHEPTDLFGPGVKDFWSPRIYSLDIVRPYPYAQTVLDLLRSVWRMTIMWPTVCINGTEPAKREWLTRHGLLQPGDVWCPLEAGEDKRAVDAPILVDDAVHYLDTFPGTGILVERPHNANEVWHGRRIPGIGALPDELRKFGDAVATV